MRVVGIIATTAAGAVALVAAITGIRSFGDIKRYLKIRSM
jgi:hypothetical protein